MRVLFVLFLAALVFVITHVGYWSQQTVPPPPSANITHNVDGVSVLAGNEVRIHFTWTNTGKGIGSASCVMNTNVYNQFGDLVNTEVTSTGTHGNIEPDGSQYLYQDQEVNPGDAQYVTPSDVSLTNCFST